MEKNQLPRHFFEKNQLQELSAAMLTHFRMITLAVPEVNEKVTEFAAPFMEQSRLEQYQNEKDAITNLVEAEEIVAYMRKIKETSNSSLLIEKALEFQDTVIPLVLKRICKSGHDIFIENAALLLANAEDKYTEDLYDIFSDIRNPYARSELCIVFGVKKKKEYTDLILQQYVQIKKERPDEDYEQGPLLALHLIYDHF